MQSNRIFFFFFNLPHLDLVMYSIGVVLKDQILKLFLRKGSNIYVCVCVWCIFFGEYKIYLS